jgi:hypothetical protein
LWLAGKSGNAIMKATEVLQKRNYSWFREKCKTAKQRDGLEKLLVREF